MLWIKFILWTKRTENINRGDVPVIPGDLPQQNDDVLIPHVKLYSCCSNKYQFWKNKRYGLYENVERHVLLQLDQIIIQI